MPSAGDTIRYSTALDGVSFNFASTGENKSWDFTKLKSSAQAVYQYKNSTTTPYVINFGFTAIGLKVADSIGSGQMGMQNVYTFFKKTTSKWEGVGIGFQLKALPLPQAGKHTNTDEIYQFPLNYKDRDSSTFVLKVPISVVVPLGNYFQNGQRINQVDGWGKISTPYQSDVECLRIKSVITEKDSIAIAITGQDPINFAFPNNRIEYKWLCKSEKIPILEVVGTEIGGNFTPTSIRYRDKYVQAAPQAPVVDFTGDKLSAKVDEVIIFADKSTNNPNAWVWTITPGTFEFINGTNQNSRDPQVKFTAKGMYTIKLSATNAVGTNSRTKTNYINISDIGNVAPMLTRQLMTYPNPASDYVNIDLPFDLNTPFVVGLFDMDGRQIKEFTLTTEIQTLRIGTYDLSNGRYTLILKQGTEIYYATINILK